MKYTMLVATFAPTLPFLDNAIRVIPKNGMRKLTMPMPIFFIRLNTCWFCIILKLHVRINFPKPPSGQGDNRE